MFEALNGLLQSLMEQKHEQITDVISKIHKTCQESVINLSLQFQQSGLFESIVNFLRNHVGSDPVIISNCLQILDAFELDKESCEIYLSEVVLELLN